MKDINDIKDGGIDSRYDRFVERQNLDREKLFQTYKVHMVEEYQAEDIFNFLLWFWKCDKISRKSTIETLRKDKDLLSEEIRNKLINFYKVRGIDF